MVHSHPEDYIKIIPSPAELQSRPHLHVVGVGVLEVLTRHSPICHPPTSCSLFSTTSILLFSLLNHLQPPVLSSQQPPTSCSLLNFANPGLWERDPGPPEKIKVFLYWEGDWETSLNNLNTQPPYLGLNMEMRKTFFLKDFEYWIICLFLCRSVGPVWSCWIIPILTVSWKL